ncbi:MAG TPA: TraR/DksA C4-type zinc finger protein [Candidatus Dormibacteraeota bacterium]|jgi:RNA polymerase-binding transcription factor DksA|nr:TraR/DksA C4-type zinc finger protein [Candidatus Dormibacteraeota bacterium]
MTGRTRSFSTVGDTHKQAMVLEDSRRDLERLSAAFQEEEGLSTPISEVTGDIVTLEYDDSDLAQALLQRETGDAIVSLLDQNRAEVDHALQRLRAGGYGTCEDCSEVIPPERLHVRPQSTRCVRCQSRWDRQRRIA